MHLSSSLRNIAIAALLLMGVAAEAPAQGGKGDRNKAQPFFDPPRQTIVTSFSAINSWTGSLLDGVQKPAALFYGNAKLSKEEMGGYQEGQLEAAEAIVIYGGPEDRWILDNLPKDKKKRPLITLLPEDTSPDARPSNKWLDVEHARKDVATLTDELVRNYKNKEDVIRKNAANYDQELAKLSDWSNRLLEPYRGAKVTLERPGIEPMLERHGIEVIGYLTTATDREPNAGEVKRFREMISHMDPPVVIRAPGEMSISLLRLTLDVPIRFIMVDPMVSGEAEPGHYVEQMRQNSINLALGLKGAREIAVAFTPAPTPTPGGDDAEEGDEAMPDDENAEPEEP
jgi:ABC-type Zn uptake system ZnuABC Zn-binding protein ZnuA